MAYAPAENITTDFNHLTSVTFYNKVGLDRLEKNFRYGQLCEPHSLPLSSGGTIQWFRYANLTTNVTPATEGAIGTSVTTSSNTVSAAPSQYVDFINMSDLLVDVAIDPIVENHASLLGYRLGLSVDTLVRTEFESVNSSVDENPVGSYLSAADFHRTRSLLAAADVQPKDGNYFMALVSPYHTYDLLNDPSTGGFTEVSKYLDPARLQTMQDRGLVGRIGGVEIWESTNVATSGSSPNTAYHCTVVGKGACGVVDLAGRGVQGFAMKNTPPTQMPIKVIQGGPQIADPAGVIGAAVSYNVKFVTKLLRTGSDDYRFRIIEADVSQAT